jgi:phospholipase/carboxylesterase
MALETIQVETGPSPTASIIWMHGLGADGHDFEPIVPEIRLSVPVRYVFPHAPRQAVTINRGMVMRAWYDELVTVTPRIESGHLLLPTGPGWGTQIDEKAVRAHPPRKRA